MQLEDFFEFEPLDTVRIKGHRVWLHDVVIAHRSGAGSADLLLQQFPALDYPKIYACLLYYHLHREQVDSYIASMQEHARRMREKQKVEMAPLIERMRQLAKGAQAEVVES